MCAQNWSSDIVNLVILTQYYPPESGAPQNRLSDLAARFSQWGHHVQVLTALPNYPGHEVFAAYKARANTTEILDGVRVVRVGLYVPSKHTFLRRLTCYLTFAASVRIRGRGLLAMADVLLMESPPLFLALAAVPLARRLGAKLVVNTSDLWPQSAVDLGMIGPGPALWAASRLEHWMYGNADLITGQTDGIVNDIARRFPGKPIALFPNGVDAALYARHGDRDRVRDEFGWRQTDFVVGYTGVMGHAQALDQALDAMTRLRGTPRIRLAFFGDGPRLEHIRARVHSEHLSAVQVFGPLPRARMPEVQAAFDAGLVPLAKGPVFEGARPSKMFEMMASAKPIILCARGEAAGIVLDSPGGPCGVVVPPEQPDRLADAIARLSCDAELAAAMGERGRAYARARFDRDAIARTMEHLLTQLTVDTDLPPPQGAAP